MGNKVKEFLNDVFGEVRTVLIDNEIWFVAKDVADSLNYSDTNAMTKKIDEDDIMKIASDKLTGANSMAREFILINESGLYQSVLTITKKDIERYDKAKKFKKWITKEVIPTIRKDGMYVNGEEEIQSVEELTQLVDEAMERKILRKFGIGVRKDWSKTIEDYWNVHNRFQFATYTNELVYKPLFNKTAKQLKEYHKVKQLRDDLFTMEELSEIAKLENEICTLVEFGADYYKVKDYMRNKYRAS